MSEEILFLFAGCGTLISLRRKESLLMAQKPVPEEVWTLYIENRKLNQIMK